MDIMNYIKKISVVLVVLCFTMYAYSQTVLKTKVQSEMYYIFVNYPQAVSNFMIQQGSRDDNVGLTYRKVMKDIYQLKEKLERAQQVEELPKVYQQAILNDFPNAAINTLSVLPEVIFSSTETITFK